MSSRCTQASCALASASRTACYIAKLQRRKSKQPLATLALPSLLPRPAPTAQLASGPSPAGDRVNARKLLRQAVTGQSTKQATHRMPHRTATVTTANPRKHPRRSGCVAWYTCPGSAALPAECSGTLRLARCTRRNSDLCCRASRKSSSTATGAWVPCPRYCFPTVYLPSRSGRRSRATDWNAPVHPSAKVVANSLYGILASPSSGCYAPILADAVTSIGRTIIKLAAEDCGRNGIENLAGDTDSLMFAGGPAREAVAVSAIKARGMELCGIDLEVSASTRDAVLMCAGSTGTSSAGSSTGPTRWSGQSADHCRRATVVPHPRQLSRPRSKQA